MCDESVRISLLVSWLFFVLLLGVICVHLAGSHLAAGGGCTQDRRLPDGTFADSHHAHRAYFCLTISNYSSYTILHTLHGADHFGLHLHTNFPTDTQSALVPFRAGVHTHSSLASSPPFFSKDSFVWVGSESMSVSCDQRKVTCSRHPTRHAQRARAHLSPRQSVRLCLTRRSLSFFFFFSLRSWSTPLAG